MKKQLLATSALAAAGLIASAGAASAQTAPASQPIQVTVGGYMYQFLTYTSQDNRTNSAGTTSVTAKPVKVQVNNDSEIWFQGKTTLANGISVGLRIELEGNTETDQIDRSFGFVEGAFGRIEIGSTANAGNTMGVHAPDPMNGMGIAGVMGLNNVIQPQSGQSNGLDSPVGTTLLRFTDNDAEKINYYTPRFEGFQLGLTYIPEVTQDRGGYNSPRFSSNTYNNGFAAGLNFTRAFGPVDIQASAGYLHFQKPDSTTVSNATLSDPSAYTFGAQVGYAGFRVGGSYFKAKDYAVITAGQTTAATSMTGNGWSGATGNLIQGSSYDLGLTYTFGPATVGIDYFHGKNDGASAVAGSDVMKAGAISGRYVLGPGVAVQAAIFNVKIDGENTSTGVDNNKATGVNTGLLLNF